MITHITSSVREVLENHLSHPLPDAFDDIKLTDLGLDSLDFFEIIMQLEQQLGMPIEVEVLTEQFTIKDLIALLEASP